MAQFIDEPSRTFNEYLLIPGFTSKDCTPENVDLSTPVVKYKVGETPSIRANIPLVSAVMQAVSNDTMAVALAKEGGISFIFGSQSIESQAEMIRKVKSYKAGFVRSDSNLRPDQTLADVLALKQERGHSTIAITEDGTPSGKIIGLVTSRDYRVSRLDKNTKISEFMTPFEKLIYAKDGVTLSEANDILWENKLNALPIIDENQRLTHFVFRKDYDSHKSNPNELLDDHKRYLVGAGINSRDYAERVPKLVEAGVDILCIDSSEGYSEYQKDTLGWIEDITTDDERKIAQKQRLVEGKHVIPVPTLQLKRDFAGYFLDPMKLWRSAKGVTEKFTDGGRMGDGKLVNKSVVRPTFSYLGEFFLSDRVLTDIAECVGLATDGVASVDWVFENTEPDNLNLTASIKVQRGMSVFDTAKRYQRNLVKEVEAMTAFNVVRADVEVNEVV